MIRILAPTDFSDNAHNALRVAMQLAQRYSGEVIFTHAMSTPPVPATSPESLFQSFYENEQVKNQERLRKEVLQLFETLEIRHKEVLYQTIVVPLPVADSIVQLMKQHSIDLTVIGCKGAGTLKRLILGSNTVELIRRTITPMLVIPAGFILNGIRNVTFVVRLSNFEYRPGFDLLFRLIRNFGSTLHFVFVLKEDDPTPNLEELLQQHNLWEPVCELLYHSTHIPDSDPVKAIDEHITRTATDLLVLMPSKKSMWEELFSESITEEMAYQAKISLYILPNAGNR